MKLSFLSGILCGVVMAAVVTFTLTIPGTNDHWRMEIVNRGGATWYFDKNGHIGWRWTVPAISERNHSVHLIVPRSQPSSDPSGERL